MIKANIIVELMKQEGLSQKELAEKINVTEASMSRYIKGERIPRIDVLVKIASVFNVSIEYLLGLKELDILQELINENNKLKRINSLLIKCIKCIRDEATGIPATYDRENMVELCEGSLICADKFSDKLDGKDVKIVESNY